MMNSGSLSYRIKVEGTQAEGYSVLGYRCPNGCVKSASYVARCPYCKSQTVTVLFQGTGTVWSSTTVRIPTGKYPPNRIIAYVDLDDGPRVLCEAIGKLAIGTRVRIDEVGIAGTPVVVL